MTLGALLFVFAGIDLLVSLLIGMAVARRQEELPPDRRTPAPYIIIGAGLVSAGLLCVLAYYWPEADLVLI